MRNLSPSRAISETTRRQRFAHYAAFLYLAFAVFIGVQLRDSALYAVIPFVNNQFGIRAQLPARWLLSEGDGVVVSVQDSSRSGFKTVIQVQVLPLADGMSVRNVIDNLALQRQITLPFYEILDVGQRLLPTQDEAVTSEYTFVSSSNDPFLALVPNVVIGQDVFIVRRNQAILITFQADSRTYTDDLAVFERFLETLEY
jgi:hypothetical protein